ncbi:YgjP-like metallopeptidase domain-containing protein [Halobacillus sp. B23F22_1]|uniref:YgjP-like metallopeptidase domain-containing protein n=1 Tax=Halobacillus sp. B23F22_1 TaxID=3459514 RepID=UPI00373DEF07
MHGIRGGQTAIHYKLNQAEDIYFVKIYLDDLNGICVTAPLHKSQKDVEAFLYKKREWIEEKWKKIHGDLYENYLKEEKVTYLGRKYKVIKHTSNQDASSFSFYKGKFHFTYPASLTAEEIEVTLEKKADEWVRIKADEKLNDFAVNSAADDYRLGWKEGNALYLNWRLIKRSKQDIQTVIEDLIEERSY